MNLLQTLLEADGGRVVGQLSRQFGLDETQTDAALRNLVPALAGGVKHNLAQAGGLEGLLGALQSGHHDRYLDDPSHLGRAATIEDGNAILGHLFGSKDVSRQVATKAAARTGLDPSLLKQMLPVLATMVMGAMNRQTTGAVRAPGGAADAAGGLGGLLGGLLGGGADAGAGGLLGSLLDHDRDGSVVDDVLGMLLKR